MLRATPSVLGKMGRFARAPLRGRRPELSRTAKDRGQLSRADKGDRFTDHTEYRSTRDVTKVMRTHSAVATHRGHEARASELRERGVGAQRARELGLFADPATPAEGALDRSDAAKELGLDRSGRAASDAAPYTRKMHDALTRDERRRERTSFNFPAEPSGSEYRNAWKKVGRLQSQDEEAEALRDRLAAEHGLYPEQRLDAYMLGDQEAFPLWVRELHRNVRDSVMYGGIGLTEDDEVLRRVLAQKPREAREVEWRRLKAARAYREGQERPLTPTEVRNAAQGRRRHYWLHRKRMRRATELRTLALRKPEKFATGVTGDVDFSKRLALVARHVEAKVPTKGQWPLSAEQLRAGQQRLQREESEAAVVDQKLPATAAARQAHGAMREALQRMQRDEREVKRISRRSYAQRYTAVSHGDQDIHGRKFRTLKRDKKLQRFDELSPEEMAVERKLPHLPKPHSRAPTRAVGEGWTKRYSPARVNAGVPSNVL